MNGYRLLKGISIVSFCIVLLVLYVLAQKKAISRFNIAPLEGLEEMRLTEKGDREVPGAFIPVPDGIVRMSSFGESKLFRIPLKSLFLPGAESSDPMGDGVLLMPNPHIADVEVFALHSRQFAYRRHALHNTLTVSQQSLPMRYPAILTSSFKNLAFASEEEYLYLQVHAYHPLSCGVYLMDKPSFLQLYLRITVFYFLFFSAMLAFAFAYLFLFVITGEPAHGRGLLCQLCLFLLASAFNRNLQLYFDLSLAAVTGIAWAVYGLFHVLWAYDVYLHLRHRTWIRRLAKVSLYAQLALMPILLETAFQCDYFWTFLAVLAGTGANLLGNTVVVLFLLRDKERPRTVFFAVLTQIALCVGMLGFFASVFHPGFLEVGDTVYLSAFLLTPACYACFLFDRTRARFDQSFASETRAVDSKQLKQRDPVTGLSNKTYLEYAVGENIKNALVTAKAFSFIMIDIDDFKDYNDAWGGQEGTRGLELVARLIRDSLREQDVAARYGDEAFSVLLYGAGLTIAQIVAERIRASCVRRSVTLGEGRGLTVSLGVSLFHPGDTPKSLIQRADEALSRAKLLGCNRVELQD